MFIIYNAFKIKWFRGGVYLIFDKIINHTTSPTCYIKNKQFSQNFIHFWCYFLCRCNFLWNCLENCFNSKKFNTNLLNLYEYLKYLIYFLE